jgi:hypothetical protein
VTRRSRLFPALLLQSFIYSARHFFNPVDIVYSFCRSTLSHPMAFAQPLSYGSFPRMSLANGEATLPQGLKPSSGALLCGTAEAVPFVQRSFLSFSALAVAPNQQFAP